MALTDVKTYFRARAVTAGLAEWRDAFSVENIPSTLIDKAFHVELGAMSGIRNSQDVLDCNIPLVFRFFVKGYRDTATGYDTATLLLESILKDSVSAVNRLNQTNIKNVQFSSGRLVPIGSSNDNVIMGEINFNVLVCIAPS